jgi:hypothetical protein
MPRNTTILRSDKNSKLNLQKLIIDAMELNPEAICIMAIIDSIVRKMYDIGYKHGFEDSMTSAKLPDDEGSLDN